MLRGVLIVIILFVLLASGCNETDIQHSYTNDIVELNKRQIDILEEAGLPTNYDELDLSQKSSIVSIEELLVYLENKYKESFVYKGYVAASTLEREHLIAYPSDGSPNDEVIVYRTYIDGEYDYEDNYLIVSAKPIFEEKVREFVSNHIDIREVKIFCNVISVDGDVTSDNVFGNVSGSVYIFLNDEYFTLDDYELFLNACDSFLVENSNGKSYSIWVAMADKGYLETINNSNFENKLTEDFDMVRNASTISSMGKLKRL